MRLLKVDSQGEFSLTGELQSPLPRYAILSHRWGDDRDEIDFDDLKHESWKNKAGFAKIRFCGEQAKKDNLEYFWVDTCCINKANYTEYSEAINSMFRWYRDAVKCYVYLSDVSALPKDKDQTKYTWESTFRESEWFTRGWTLQELLAPVSVEFFSREGERLGDKETLKQQIHEITDIPIAALEGTPLPQFSVDERLRWAAKRITKRKEDGAYCLLGIFNIFMPLIYGEEEHALTRLKEEIDKSQRHPGNVHWRVPRSSNTLFTGRKDILDDLERTVRAAIQQAPGRDQLRVVISGLGGQGKSELSLQLAHRVRSSLWGVFWVDVSTQSLAENGFLGIAHLLQTSALTWEEGWQGLANIQRPWMLILDNADDPYIDYHAYLPPGSSGVVVLTSRNAQYKQYATARHVPLEGLSIDEARELLLKAADLAFDQRPQLREDARSVATLLHSHPLALIQAGAYVGGGHCTLAEYPRVYEHHRKRLLGFRPSQARSRYRDVYATFEASVEILRANQTQSSQDALELLPLLAVCGPSQLPLFVFEAAWNGAQRISVGESGDENDLQPTAWHLSRLPSLMQASGDAWESFRLVEAVNALRAFALVSTNTDNGHIIVSMHPLVHTWARDRQDERQQHESWIAMGCVVAVSGTEEEMWRVHARQLQPHLQAATSWEMGCAFRTEPRDAVAYILIQCGELLRRMRDDNTLFLLLGRLCTHLGLHRTTVNPGWIELYDLIGENLLDYGKVREAVQVLEEVVRIREQTLAEDHPHRLVSQHVLARAYEANGQIKEAVKILEEVVRIREQTQAKDHPDRLSSQHVLARVYEANGQIKEAVKILEEVVRIREQTQAKDHPHRLSSKHELAGVYRANGQVKEAVELLEEVVRIEQALAEDHPDRLASRHSLAAVYEANGQVKEAVELLEEVVRIRQALAEDHPERLASRHSLAAVYKANRQVKEAVELLEEVVRIRQALAENHPSRLASQHELAGVYIANGQVKEAVELLEKVVRIRQALAEDHPDRLASRQVLAGAYEANGQVKEAVELLEEVVRIEQALAEDHPDRLASQHNLAVYLWKLGQHSAALELMGHVVEIRKQALDHDHRDRVASEWWLKYFEDESSERGWVA
ncbi:hypothetical protein, variant [Phialophora macrospora]|uniref:Heterokaryon incompatibility domain-containing protein n=1 Tax=Phialophora macrospora TaxID=1851006 RepID=A0A0D2FQH1_9EURO|nr:hypothetical protein, variant [Phialophora macrospora]